MPDPVRAALGLGSNRGDRRSYLTLALRHLAALGPIQAVSSLYQTAPVGGPPQDPYLNAVVVVETERTAREVLDAGQGAERAAGRTREERWGPRTLDVDLLLFGSERIDRPGLVVPHPRLHLRRFALEPLAEAWPGAALPDGIPVLTLLARVLDQEVAQVQGPGWGDEGEPEAGS